MDARRRQLERELHESGSPEEQTAYLREQLRTGDADLDLLSVAAILGHAPARAALADTPPKVPTRSLGYAFGVSGYIITEWRRIKLPTDGDRPFHDLLAVLDWRARELRLDTPDEVLIDRLRALCVWRSEASGRAAVALMRPLLAALPHVEGSIHRDLARLEGVLLGESWAHLEATFLHRWDEAGVALHAAVLAARPDKTPEGKVSRSTSILQVYRSAGLVLAEHANCETLAAQSQLQAAVEAEVLPWALGYGDPLQRD